MMRIPHMQGDDTVTRRTYRGETQQQHPRPAIVFTPVTMGRNLCGSLSGHEQECSPAA